MLVGLYIPAFIGAVYTFLLLLGRLLLFLRLVWQWGLGSYGGLVFALFVHCKHTCVNPLDSVSWGMRRSPKLKNAHV
jgi:hypothetical protein